MKKLFDFITALLLLPFRPKKAKVLELVNSARYSLDLPRIDALPEGEMGRSVSCPLAHALGGIVGVDGICFEEHYKARYVAQAWQTRVSNRGHRRYVVDLPDTLRHFVRDFDLGAYRRLA